MTGIDDERAYFQIFGVYDKVWDIWLSWPETQRVSDVLGFPTTPVIYCEDNNDSEKFETVYEARTALISYAEYVIV